MDDNSLGEKMSLLGQLRLDRSEPTPSKPSSRRRFVWIGVGAATAAALSVAAVGLRSSDTSSKAVAATSGPAAAPVAPPVVEVRPDKGASLLDASGYVVARRRATVSSQITGRVVEVLIEEGQRVERDQVLARLDDATWRAALEEAKAQVEQARASLQGQQTALSDAQPIFERSMRQIEAGMISAQAFDTERASYNARKAAAIVGERTLQAAQASLAAARHNLEDTVIRAPFAGIVTEKAAQPGEIVSPISAGGGFTRTGIGTIVDMDSLEVEVDVSESFIDRVRADQPVAVKLNAYPDWNIAGHVIATIPAADRAKATIKVRIGLEEKDARIIPDMGAQVAFLAAAPDKVAARQP